MVTAYACPALVASVSGHHLGAHSLTRVGSDINHAWDTGTCFRNKAFSHPEFSLYYCTRSKNRLGQLILSERGMFRFSLTSREPRFVWTMNGTAVSKSPPLSSRRADSFLQTAVQVLLASTLYCLSNPYQLWRKSPRLSHACQRDGRTGSWSSLGLFGGNPLR